ncbi:hemerythrin domain-containing protein [Sphingomonas sp. KC8]|uniref:hemerythrin domain-containing protein n=1 Tax=Sphingomonas sp. KC8 TaxID=1030157 RepID=UPI000248BB98|nr:hemerythrin domain-containing protein [Sphingomonas sp. KC8]ARS28496.1 hypothetical protein KC8_14540 [Sphingomonas sp. KC8]
MSTIPSLRREHSDLTRRAMRLRQAIAQPTMSPRLLQERREFADLLARHLAAEDGLIYPSLIADGDRRMAAVARMFVDELGGLGAAWSEYCRLWDDRAIAADWRGFAAATEPLLNLLATRILREDRILYPLAERAVARRAA